MPIADRREVAARTGRRSTLDYLEIANQPARRREADRCHFSEGDPEVWIASLPRQYASKPAPDEHGVIPNDQASVVSAKGRRTTSYLNDGIVGLPRGFMGAHTVGATRQEVGMESRIHVITLAVGDLDRALEFYRDGLGLDSPGVVGTEFAGDGNRTIAGASDGPSGESSSCLGSRLR